MVAQPKHYQADLYPVPEPKITFLDDLDCVICTDHSCINCQIIQKENADWLLKSIPESMHGYSEPGIGFSDFNEYYYGQYTEAV